MTLEQWLRQSALPKNEARMLLQYITGYSRVQLITQGDAEMPSETAAKLDAVAQRRLNGEPMAYILGEREFYGRMFAVNPHVLIPRPETEHLVEAVMACLPQGGKVWDLGTGSGAIAVSITLERPECHGARFRHQQRGIANRTKQCAGFGRGGRVCFRLMV